MPLDFHLSLRAYLKINYSKNSLYFPAHHDAFWNKSDQELIDIGKRELEKIGIVPASLVLDGMVMRTAEAYPIYDEHYRKHLDAILRCAQERNRSWGKNRDYETKHCYAKKENSRKDNFFLAYVEE